MTATDGALSLQDGATNLSRLQRWAFVARTLGRHLMRFCWLYALAAVGFMWFHAHYWFAINMTTSLPHTLFLVSRDERPSLQGDYVAFEWRRNEFYGPNWVFVKRIAGVGGQTVSVVDRNVFVDGKPVGYAKAASKRGIPLEPIKPGVIPAGYVYAQAPHPDSLDSRYAVTGLIEPNRIVGKAYALF
jgi:conjugal transfer pilin signal peptidase TrbI